VQLEGLITHNDRVACIDAPLVADDHIGGLTQEVGDFTFSFVTPLGTNNDNVCQGFFDSATVRTNGNYPSLAVGLSNGWSIDSADHPM
jgi:hypothetical protein